MSGSTASSDDRHGRLRWPAKPSRGSAAEAQPGRNTKDVPSQIDKRIAEWLFLLTFFVYGYFHAGGGWNQNSQFDLTRAIVEQHTFAIDAYASNTGDVSMHGGHVYSNKSPGLSLIGALPYALIQPFVKDLAIASWLVTLLTVVPFAALIPALLYREGRKRGFTPLWCAMVSLLIAFATQLFPYSTLYAVHVPAGALMLVAISTPRPWLAGLAAGAAVAVTYLCAPILLCVFLLRGWRALPATVPPLLAMLVYQRLCFGGFATISIATMDKRFVTPGRVFGIFGMPSMDALYGITISPYRGLFFFAPVLVMAIVGMILWRRSRELACILIVTAVFFGFNVTFNGWEAGFGIGARYLVPLIPLWGIAVLYAKPRALVLALGALSAFLNFAATAVDPQPSGTIPRPMTQYILPLLFQGRFSPEVPITPPWSAATFTGHTSVNRLGHDEAIVFTKHAPDSLAADWASFNLGEPFFGPGDARSLIPVLLLLLGGASAIAIRARRASPS
ncbi:MAG: hypothetical protein JOZ54_08060 [Acidobacteria bacterium]|nr:hypothetical protein [Acidobacteriota bacterium]